MAVHQVAKFSTSPKSCLLETSEEGLACNPDECEGLEAFVDGDFSRGFNATKVEDFAYACS